MDSGGWTDRSLLTRVSGVRHHEILLAEGESRPAHCDALGVGLPTDIPVNLSVWVGREEVHCVQKPLSIGMLEHGRIELEI